MYTRFVAAGLALALLCSCGGPQSPDPTPTPAPKTASSESPAAFPRVASISTALRPGAFDPA